MSQEFVSLNDLQVVAEELPEVLESGDYIDYDLIPVGLYLSNQRRITARQKADGTTTFQVEFIGGVVNTDTGATFGNGSFPLKTYVSTKKYSLPNRPGQTSSAAQYLRELGIDPKTVDSVVGAMGETETAPVRIFIGWTNKTEKLADGTYEKETMKTRDFNVGTKEEPNYQPMVQIGEKVFQAKHRVQGFRKAA